MSKISIIVPIYNVEKYLCRCLESIRAQTFKDFEYILVDDGSLDNCPSICEEYALKDNRIIVIHQKNTGRALARDTGIRKAVSDFLVFVDGDDWIESNALELLYKKQQEKDADIVMGGFNSIYSSKIRSYYYPEIADDENILVYFFLNTCKTLWGKLYRKSLFDKYIVPDTNIGEDAIVNVQVFSRIKQGKLQNIDIPIYNYDRRTDGIIMQVTKKFSYNAYYENPMISCRLWIEEYLEKTNQNDEIRSAFMYYMIHEGIIPYLQFNKRILKSETSYFYNHYYLKCYYKKRIILPQRIIIPLFYHSIRIGKWYTFFLNKLIILVKIILGYVRRS